jgi:hypothetical protein
MVPSALWRACSTLAADAESRPAVTASTFVSNLARTLVELSSSFAQPSPRGTVCTFGSEMKSLLAFRAGRGFPSALALSGRYDEIVNR